MFSSELMDEEKPRENCMADPYSYGKWPLKPTCCSL